MKITAIETLRLTNNPNLIWVLVKTDEGITGLGETYFGTSAVEADIHDRIAPMIIGEDASRIEYLNMKMQPYTGFASTGAEVRALSAVDVALWDIAGKAANKPVCDLLGGRTREKIQVYNTCAGPDYVSKTSAVRPDNFGHEKSPSQGQRYEDLDAFMQQPAELAASLLDMGISSMKIWPFDFAEGAVDGIDISTADLKKALQPFEAIRAAHGDRMRIKAELHGLWSLNAVKKIASALEPLDIDWIEDPLYMDRLEEVAEIEAFTTTPIAGGETLASLGQFKELIDDGNIGTPIQDVVWSGGISSARKVAALAEARARPIAFHDCSGPVTLAVSSHLALSLRNVREQEFTRGFYYGWYHEFVDELPMIEKGMITVNQRPGLGMALLPELFDREDAIYRISNNA